MPPVPDDLPCLAETLATALIVQLLRKGALDQEDIDVMAASLSDEARHLLNCLIIEAEARPPTPPRAPLRLIDGGSK
jgi:hypothetical protein